MIYIKVKRCRTLYTVKKAAMSLVLLIGKSIGTKTTKRTPSGTLNRKAVTKNDGEPCAVALKMYVGLCEYYELS